MRRIKKETGVEIEIAAVKSKTDEAELWAQTLWPRWTSLIAHLQGGKQMSKIMSNDPKMCYAALKLIEQLN